MANAPRPKKVAGHFLFPAFMMDFHGGAALLHRRERRGLTPRRRFSPSALMNQQPRDRQAWDRRPRDRRAVT